MILGSLAYDKYKKNTRNKIFILVVKDILDYLHISFRLLHFCKIGYGE